MCKVRVLKFGGTSVGNGERIHHVATIIASVVRSSEEAFPVVVVSAMAGVTDALLTIARLSCTGKREAVTHELDELKQRHLEAATQAITGNERLKVVLVDLEQCFRLLKAEVALLPRCYHARPYAADASPVAAWGERLSARIMAAAVQDVGVQAKAIREEVIVLYDQHHPEPASFGEVIGSDPLLEATRVQAAALLQPLLERKVVPILPGFIGRTSSGVVKTLGRGGSDRSATVLGAVLEECTGVTIFTDVDGVFSADPRLVGEEQVRLFPRLSYAEASHLARSGARVLHPQTLAPIIGRRLPVTVRNTFRLHLPGTMIGPEEEHASEPASAWVKQ